MGSHTKKYSNRTLKGGKNHSNNTLKGRKRKNGVIVDKIKKLFRRSKKTNNESSKTQAEENVVEEEEEDPATKNFKISVEKLIKAMHAALPTYAYFNKLNGTITNADFNKLNGTTIHPSKNEETNPYKIVVRYPKSVERVCDDADKLKYVIVEIIEPTQIYSTTSPARPLVQVLVYFEDKDECNTSNSQNILQIKATNVEQIIQALKSELPNSEGLYNEPKPLTFLSRPITPGQIEEGPFRTNIEELEAKLKDEFPHYVIETSIVKSTTDEPLYAEPEFLDQYRLVIRESRKTHKYCDGMVPSNNRNYATVDLFKLNEGKKAIQSFRVDVNNTCRQGEITATGADKIKLYNTATLIKKIRERVFFENIQDLQGELMDAFQNYQVINKFQSMKPSIDEKKKYRIEIRNSTSKTDIKKIYCNKMQPGGFATVDLVYVPQENKEENKELYIRSFRVDINDICNNKPKVRGNVMFYNIPELIEKIRRRIKHNDNIQNLKTRLKSKFPNIEVDYIIKDGIQAEIFEYNPTRNMSNQYNENKSKNSNYVIEILDNLTASDVKWYMQNCEVQNYSGYASVRLLNKTSNTSNKDPLGFNVVIEGSCNKNNRNNNNNNEGKFYNIEELLTEIQNKISDNEGTYMEVATSLKPNGEDKNNNNGTTVGGSRKTKKHRKKSKSKKQKKQSNKKHKSH
jgi:hypothetical protein